MKLRKQVVVPVGIVVLLLGIYIVFCFLAPCKDFLINTRINGIDVSDMTKQEAIEALNKQYNNDSKDLKLTYTLSDKNYTIDISDNIEFDAKAGVEKTYNKLNSNFFAYGYNYFFNKNNYVPVTIKDDKVLIADIKETKLLNYDTKKATTYEVSDGKITFTKGTSGKKVEQKEIVNQTKEALNNYELKSKIECNTVVSNLDEDEMETMYKNINGKAVNATLSLDEDYNYKIVDEKLGAKYNLEEAKKAYDNTKEGKTFSIDATIVEPTIDKETLKKNLFKDVLGEYTTYVSGSSTRRNNVKLAGIKCNKIMLPGETFSYNDTVGQRTKEAGFGEAGAYVNGETVDEVGGGVCQASSTLYNAVLLSNLEIVERHNHTYISSYVPLGRDATVSWGGPDFKFKNNTDYPIKIVVTYNGSLNVKIYGTDLEDTTVSITCTKYSTISPKVTYKKDNTLEEGTEKVEKSGSNGAKCQTYRKVYKKGKLVSTTKESYSYYKAHERIVIQGTKKKEEKKEETTKKENTTENNSSTNTNENNNTNTNENTNAQNNNQA